MLLTLHSTLEWYYQNRKNSLHTFKLIALKKGAKSILQTSL